MSADCLSLKSPTVTHGCGFFNYHCWGCAKNGVPLREKSLRKNLLPKLSDGVGEGFGQLSLGVALRTIRFIIGRNANTGHENQRGGPSRSH